MSSTTDPEQLRAEIEHTRADLAETVDALSAKLDVKAQAAHKVGEVKAAVVNAATKAKPYRRQLVGAASGLLVAFLGMRTWRRRR